MCIPMAGQLPMPHNKHLQWQAGSHSLNGVIFEAVMRASPMAGKATASPGPLSSLHCMHLQCLTRCLTVQSPPCKELVLPVSSQAPASAGAARIRQSSRRH